MSKIFDALKGTRNEVADLLPSLLETGDFPPPASGRELPLETMAPPAYARAAEPQPAPLPAPTMRQLSIAIPSASPLLPFADGRSHAAEQYRILRTKLSHHPRKPKVILISSAGPGDGKSVTAINLAGALALRTDDKVLLVDADFRRPAIDALLNAPPSPGLCEAITGACSFDDAVMQAEQYPNLNVLTNGRTKVNPTELLESDAWRNMCDLMRQRYSFVIIDSPPMGTVADCELLQMSVDGTILVVRPEHTRRGSCWNAIDSIPKDKFLGVLLNCIQPWFLSQYNNYSYTYDNQSRKA
jgi:capsular exopolysaccharide synthesis family protein